MADREKVINELVENIESALFGDSDYVDCVQTDLLQTVVGLLKAQEPRVMTLGEIFTVKNVDVWLEESCETQVHPLLLVESESAERYQITYFWPKVCRPIKSYGKTWRCWTSRPTDEQRRAVKWDATT